MFQPVIPFEGLSGWRFLQRTYDSQFEAFSSSASLKRDTDYFREKISSVETAQELVEDRRLLSVALGAFGLQDDINNKFFIQKMLQEGTTNQDSFANRFADSRYREFSEAFGFGPGELRRNKLSDFSDKIISSFERQSFEVSVGNQSQTLRISLSAERTFSKIAESDSSEAGKWFTVMGELPMRRLFETAFSLPASFSQIDLDQQKEILARKSLEIFGTSDPADFDQPELQDKLISRYTALSQVQANSSLTSSNSVALLLLSQFA